MIFDRVKPLDDILANASAKGLHRSLGAFQLTMLGIGSVIGAGIFVLTSEAAQKAGPAMILSFVIAGLVCAFAALCYSELAAMVPVAGSAYTYTYAVVGEAMAWTVGWALILEYALGASAVAVAWSGYIVGMLDHLHSIVTFLPDVHVPKNFALGPREGGIVNAPAVIISLLVTGVLIVGTSESARVNAILVAIKLAALSMFVVITLPAARVTNFTPFMPTHFGGVAGAAASIFFAYVGFDTVSTAAEETRNPQRNMPIGLIGSLIVCTIFYMIVAAGAIGSPIGAQPVTSAAGALLHPGTPELATRCTALVAQGASEPLACSPDALAHVLRILGWPVAGSFLSVAAIIALPSVVLTMIYGQTRIFFAMARDGLLPQVFTKTHARFKTPYVVTAVTGIFCALFSAFAPVGQLADFSNSGTLFAFAMVAVAVLVLRRTAPERHRPFRTPLVRLVAPAAILGCLYLFVSLDSISMLVLPAWAAIGLLVYVFYGRSRSKLASGAPGKPRS